MSLRFALSPQEAADMLGVSVSSIYRAIRRSEIPAEKVSGALRIPARALVERFGEPIEVEVVAA